MKMQQNVIGRCSALPAGLSLTLFVWAPLLLIAAYSFFSSGVGAQVVYSPTLVTWKAVFRDRVPFLVLARTVEMTAISVATTALVGYIAALGLWNTQGRIRLLLFCGLIAPSWISYVVRTMSWMQILGDNGLVNSILMGAKVIHSPLHLLYTDFAVGVGMIHYLMPFMIINVFVALESVDRNVMHAARTLGAGHWHTFWSVIFPLTLPGLATGLLICTILTLGSYVTPLILGGPDTTYYSSLIYETFITELNWPLGAALVCVLLAVMGAGVLLYGKFVGFAGLTRRTEA